MTIERWKDIKNYEGLYQISNTGRIRRLKGYMCKKQRLLKHRCWNKYPCIQLCKNSRRKTYYIHTLVLTTFVGYKPKQMGCRHLDGNPQNNELSNLMWGTQSDNILDAIKHGTRFQPDNCGQKQGRAKLTNIKVKKIKHLLMSGISQIQIAKQFHVHPSTISYIALGKTWKYI